MVGGKAADVLTPYELSADAMGDREESASPAACPVIGVKGSDPHWSPEVSVGL